MGENGFGELDLCRGEERCCSRIYGPKLDYGAPRSTAVRKSAPGAQVNSQGHGKKGLWGTENTFSDVFFTEKMAEGEDNLCLSSVISSTEATLFVQKSLV